MFHKNRCYLCGGKLVNGKCVECGLDNARSWNKTYRLNESSIEKRLKQGAAEKSSNSEKKRHIYQAADSADKDTAGTKSKIKSGIASGIKSGTKIGTTGRMYRSTVSGKIYPSRSRSRSMRGRARLSGLVIMLVFAFFGIIREAWDEYSIHHRAEQVVGEWETEEYEYDPYEYVQRELSEVGEEFETELEPGNYKVGVHIPEGNYRMLLLEGEGYIHIEDYENSIYMWQDFGEDEEYDEVQEAEDMRLYAGALLEVQGGMRLRLETDCAQTEKMTSMENPLADTIDTILLEEGEEVIAGEDFPAGVYDAQSVSGWTSVDVRVLLGTDYEDEDMNYSYEGFWLSSDGRDHIFRNVVFAEGTKVIPEDADIELVPSEKIENEDYEAYYENYR